MNRKACCLCKDPLICFANALEVCPPNVPLTYDASAQNKFLGMSALQDILQNARTDKHFCWRRKFTMSIQLAKAYEDAFVMLSGPH